MARTVPRINSLDKYPYVNIFRLPAFDVDRNLLLKGDVNQVTDPEIHRRVWNVIGDIPVNNCLTFPKEGAMQLPGRFLYILAKARGKAYFIHVEVTADRGPSVRISISNTYKENIPGVVGSSAMTNIKLKTPQLNRWGVIAIDVEQTLSSHLPNRLFKNIKSINVCAAISVRAMISSSLVYKEDSLPQEACLPIIDKKLWIDTYDWYWIHEPSLDDPAQRAERPRNPLVLSVNYASPNRSIVSSGSLKNDQSVMNISRSPLRLATLRSVQHVNNQGNVLMGRGKTAMWTSGRIIVQQNTETGEQQYLIGHKNSISQLFSDINRKLLGSFQNGPPQIRLWNLSEQRQLGTALNLKDHLSEVTTACISDEVHTMLVAGTSDKKKSGLLLYDCSNPSKVKLSLKYNSSTDSAVIVQAAFVPMTSSDGCKFCTCDNGPSIKFWRVKGNQLRYFPYHDKSRSHNFNCIAFDPDLKRHAYAAVTLYAGTVEGFVHIINYETNTTAYVAQAHYNPITGISPSGGVCATSDSEGFFKVWPLDMSSSHIETQLDASIVSISQSRTGLHTVCLTSLGKICVVDFALRSLLKILDSHQGSINSCVHHGSRSLLATSSTDGWIRVWDEDLVGTCAVHFDCSLLPSLFGKGNSISIDTIVGQHSKNQNIISGQLKSPSKNDKMPLCLAWSKDVNSAVLACGYSRGSVRIFDVDHRCVMTSYSTHSHDVLQVLYTSNKKWLATMDCLQICFADTRHNYHVSRVVRFNESIPNVKLKESVSGEVLGIIGASESKIHLFNCEYGLELGYIQDHESDAGSACCILNIAFGEGDLLAAATSEGHVTQWRLPSPMPPPPPPEDTDFGISSPLLPATKLSKTGAGTFGGSVLELSPEHNFIISNHATKSNIISVAEFPLHEGTQSPEVIKNFSYPHSRNFTQAVWTPDSKTLITTDEGGCFAVWEFDNEAREDVDEHSVTQNYDIPHTVAESTGGVSSRLFNKNTLPHQPRPETNSIPVSDPDELGLYLSGSLLRNVETVESAVRGDNLTFSVCGGVVSSSEHVLMNNGFVTTMSLSNNQKYIAVGVYHRTDPARVIIWDLNNTTCAGVLPLQEARYVQDISWCSSDEKILIICQDRFLVAAISSQSIVYASAKVHGTLLQGIFLNESGNTVVVCADSGLLVDTIQNSSSQTHQTIGLQCLTIAQYFDTNLGMSRTNLIISGGCDGYLLLWIIDEQRPKAARIVAKHQPSSNRFASISGVSFMSKSNTAVCTTQQGSVLVVEISAETPSVRFRFTTLREVQIPGNCSRTSPCLRQRRSGCQVSVFTDYGGTVELDLSYQPELVCSSSVVTSEISSSLFESCGELFLSDTEHLITVAASNGFIGVWHRASNTLITSVGDIFEIMGPMAPVTGTTITQILTHEKLGILISDSEGYLSVVGMIPATTGGIELQLKHKFKVSQYGLTDIIWAGNYELANMFACDANDNVIKLSCKHLVSQQGRSQSGIESEVLLKSTKQSGRSKAGVQYSGKLDQAALNSSIVLHKKDQTIDVFEYDEKKLSVLRTFVPPTECFDTCLTPSGSHVVYLVSATLVFFDFRGIAISRTIDLHKPCFRSFKISRDEVFISLLSPSCSTITLCDFDYGTMQDIDGHVNTPLKCGFTSDCKNFYSISREGGAELFKWDVKVLE